MPIYLICIYVLIFILVVLCGILVGMSVKNKKKNKKITIDNLRQKKSSLYIKYDLEKQDITINNYTYLNLDVCKSIIDTSKKNDFYENVKKSIKNNNDKFKYVDKKEYFTFNLSFSYRDKIDDVVILRCDYDVEKTIKNTQLLTIDQIKEIHHNREDKNASLCYLNIKDFNSLNQRYGQECGDYILEVVKERLAKIDKRNLWCSYLKSDQFIVYYGKKVNKNKTMKLIKNINKKLIKQIDIGYMNIDVVFGVGICVGAYEELDEFLKGAYIAADYAKKRRENYIVIYNEGMKLEENLVSICEEELNDIIKNKEINISYNPVFNTNKSKFIGYISTIQFSNNLLSFDKLKNVAIQRDKINQLMNIIIDNQLINYIKKRTNKNSKLFINLKLEDLTSFIEVYLSNPSYSDCKIVICLDVRRGYEMINKFSSISSNISKIIEEGIEFAPLINYNNLYDYDYILKNSNYLILDSSIASNTNSVLVKNKTMNIIELAKNYDLELFATDIKEYVQYENLLKYNTHYFSGPYFGKGAKKPNDIEQTKTKIFAKFLKDSKKNKNN